jgi:hypothetical protein
MGSSIKVEMEGDFLTYGMGSCGPYGGRGFKRHSQP